jgi:hypothetical protein
VAIVAQTTALMAADAVGTAVVLMAHTVLGQIRELVRLKGEELPSNGTPALAIILALKTQRQALVSLSQRAHTYPPK